MTQKNMSKELRKVWNMKVKVVPGVIRALGTPSQALEKRMLT